MGGSWGNKTNSLQLLREGKWKGSRMERVRARSMLGVLQVDAGRNEGYWDHG